ncbi:Hypothetical predicted protein [Octopus vulgaris]|uniref:Phospholipase A2-like domain-containing protein n=1 Tax=Octopus vulgaris TaxID=6645 RepID=A0AA36BJU5_OCTVU|nr:Hypothetical predicted protein [Octopus vulgaris]
MPPIRKHLYRKTESREFRLPGYEFLGPGTNICKRRYDTPLNALDTAAKALDIDYADPYKGTWEADIKNVLPQGPTGILAAAAITAKHYLGLDNKFRKTNNNDNTPVDINNHCDRKNMADNQETSSESQPSNGWAGTSHGTPVPPRSDNFMREYTIKRTFRNMVKTTNMNGAKVTFQQFQGNEKGCHQVGHYYYGTVSSEDYIIPYWLTSWIKPIHFEQSIKTATSYRIKSIGFEITDIIGGEWTTQKNEEVFMQSPYPYFELFKDTGC